MNDRRASTRQPTRRNTTVTRFEIADWHRVGSDSGHVVLHGFHALKHAIRFNAPIPAMVTDRKAPALDLAAKLAPDIVARLEQDLEEVSKAALENAVGKIHTTRIASIVRKPAAAEIRSRLRSRTRQRPVIVLENPRNLGNIGAVIRLAAGMDSAGVITTGHVDPWHENVLVGSAGLHFATDVISGDVDSLPAGPLFALDPSGNDLRSFSIPNHALLAFGSERHGISDELKARADRLLSIPMRSKVSSYNLATSVAMTLFHWASTGGRSITALLPGECK